MLLHTLALLFVALAFPAGLAPQGAVTSVFSNDSTEIGKDSLPGDTQALVGGIFDIDTSTSDDGEPDVAYDRNTRTYLAVWRRKNFVGLYEVRGQLFDASGLPLGSTILIQTGTATLEAPHVGNVDTADAFLISWKQSTALTDSVFVRTYSAITGVLSNTVLVHAGRLGTVFDVDAAGGVGVNPQGMVTWRVDGVSTTTDGIYGSVVDVPSAGDPTPQSEFVIVADSSGVTMLDDPVITKADSGGLYLVAYSFMNLFSGTSWDIYAIAIDRNGQALTAPYQVTSDVRPEIKPAVDGGSATTADYAIAFEATVNTVTDRLELTTLRYGNGALSTLANTLVATTGVMIESHGVSWAPGRATIGWVEGPFSPTVYTVLVQDFDIPTAVSVRPMQSVISPRPPQGGVEIAMVPGQPASLAGSGSGALLFAYDTSGAAGNVYGQLYDSFPLTGTVVNLGGLCGLGGTVSTQGDAAVGNGSFLFAVANVDAAASLTVLNITNPVTPIPCGSCNWLPFETIYVKSVVAGKAVHAVSIPFDLSLVGNTYEAQWTTLTPSSSPCTIFPGISISDRLGITLDF